MIDILSVIEKHGYSKKMLADALGCSHQSIMQIVNPGSNPTYKKLQLIADVIGADIREFFPSTEDLKVQDEIRGSFNCPVCGKPLLVSVEKFTEQENKRGRKPSRDSVCPHCKQTILVSINKNQSTTRCIRRQEVVRQQLHNANNQETE